MKSLPKILFLLAAVSLLMLFVFPLWRITLLAPQYPSGITMYIWINQITGTEPSTLQNINILNHYIGMKFIEPDAIPEFTYFPKVIMAMSALGMIVAFIGKRSLWVTWLVLLALLCAIGMYDFYLWEYDYGHNLNPHAPIQIPGMVYQPPLIGNKLLLNFMAKSWPYIGGYFVGITFVLGGLAIWLKRSNA